MLLYVEVALQGDGFGMVLVAVAVVVVVVVRKTPAAGGSLMVERALQVAGESSLDGLVRSVSAAVVVVQ